MNQKTIFSIVDLEATGPNNPEGNRIIQFSCTFVQNEKIFDKFTTKINPEINIPERITKLTGIDDTQVQSAPTFSQIAPQIYNMLSDTVFVAHNVNFDFPLLNNELLRIKHQQLNISAIDTVTLSQILLPTLPGFRLSDISNHFNIVHKNPHSADSDASATAWLLILLIRRLKFLPLITLKQIIDIHPKLPLNTFEVFRYIYKYRRFYSKNYNHDIFRSQNGLVLRKEIYPRNDDKSIAKHYPTTQNTKRSLFNNDYSINQYQNKIMNTVYHNFNDTDKEFRLLIENPNSISQSIDYLLPLLYLAKPRGEKIIISSDDTKYIDSILNKIIPMLNYYLPFSINGLKIANNQNYIDLTRFITTLYIKGHSNQIQFLKAKILVWLTMTTTYDMSELNLHNGKGYLQEISINDSLNNQRINDYKQRLIQSSDIIIINHDYLYHNAENISKQFNPPYLVINDANNLSLRVFQENQQRIRMNDINLNLRKINRYLNPNWPIINHHIFSKFTNSLENISFIFKKFNQKFSKAFLNKSQLNINSNHWEGFLDSYQLKEFFELEYPYLKRALKLNVDLININHKLIEKFAHHLSLTDYYHFNIYYQHCLNLFQNIKTLNNISKQVHYNNQNTIFKVRLNQPKDINNCILWGGIVDYNHLIHKKIYRYFSSLLLTDQVLFSSNRSQFIYNRLNLTRNKTRMKIIPNPTSRKLIHINKQSKMILDQVPQLVENSYKGILNLINHNQGKYLVFFHSKQIMKLVFDKLQLNTDVNINILGEEINCDYHKLRKRLANSGRGILLGTSNKWLQQSYLFDGLVIAELPFSNQDDNPIDQKYYEKLNLSERDAFVHFKLPQIKLQIKRCLNYLNYYHNYLIILDSRLFQSNYYQEIFNILPSSVIVQDVSLQRINYQLKHLID